MHKQNGLSLRKLNDKVFILELVHGKASIDLKKMITFNNSAAYVWNKIQEPSFCIEDIANILINKYDVSLQTALNDAQTLIKQWQAVGIVKE